MDRRYFESKVWNHVLGYAIFRYIDQTMDILQFKNIYVRITIYCMINNDECCLGNYCTFGYTIIMITCINNAFPM